MRVAHFAQRERAVEQSFAEHTDLLRIKAIEPANGINVAHIVDSVNQFVDSVNYWPACFATTPMFAIVSPFTIDGTARMNITIPDAGACASSSVLPV